MQLAEVKPGVPLSPANILPLTGPNEGLAREWEPSQACRRPLNWMYRPHQLCSDGSSRPWRNITAGHPEARPHIGYPALKDPTVHMLHTIPIGVTYKEDMMVLENRYGDHHLVEAIHA
jgi:hypothetical protein